MVGDKWELPPWCHSSPPSNPSPTLLISLSNLLPPSHMSSSLPFPAWHSLLHPELARACGPCILCFMSKICSQLADLISNFEWKGPWANYIIAVLFTKLKWCSLILFNIQPICRIPMTSSDKFDSLLIGFVNITQLIQQFGPRQIKLVIRFSKLKRLDI